jgi:hypothetical protein
MDFLKLLSIYQDSRSAFIKQKQESPEGNGPYSPFLTHEEAERLLRKQRFSQYASNCTFAIENLGVRLGENVDPDLLKDLSSREQSIFKLRYEKKLDFRYIASHMKLDIKDVQAIFKRTHRKIIKKIIEIEKQRKSRI